LLRNNKVTFAVRTINKKENINAVQANYLRFYEEIVLGKQMFVRCSHAEETIHAGFVSIL